MSFQHSLLKEDGGTRILYITIRYLLVWGCAVSSTRCLAGGSRRAPISPMDASKVPTQTEPCVCQWERVLSGKNVIITSWECRYCGIKLNSTQMATCALWKELDGQCYAYEIGQDGIEPFSSCTLDPRFVREMAKSASTCDKAPHRSL